jgi:hypothetical protein
MKKTYQLTAAILIALMFLTPGCKKETSNTTTLLSGNLFGFVTLYDQYGAKVTSGVSPTNVSLVATTNNQTLNTVTDSTGKYTYNNVTEGQYLLSYTNAGYGTILNAPLGFLGGGNIDHDVKLSATPNFYDSILSQPIDTLNTIVLNGTFSGTDTRKRTYVVFVGSSPAVSSAPANYLQYYTGTANNNLTTFTEKINISDLNDMGFSSGSTVYFAVYGAATSFASTSDVEDYTTGRLNFTAISSNPATTSIVLP